jgi:transcriptional regulator with XRE-family HTH domain
MPRDWWRGTMLKTARTRRKLTQAKLAEKLGVHQVTIARLESGTRRPSMAMLQRLAKALGVPITALLS